MCINKDANGSRDCGGEAGQERDNDNKKSLVVEPIFGSRWRQSQNRAIRCSRAVVVMLVEKR